MPANPWELRTEVRPLDTAAQAWREVAEVMTRRGDEIVEVARRTTEGWQAAAADSYEQHRRQVLAHLDLFTTLAGQVAASLQAIAAVVTAAQQELDRSWATVAMVPHEAVGESRHLVFHPSADEHRGAVARAQREAEEIRGRLRTALDLEGERLRAARSELVVVRQELTTLSGGRFPGGWSSGDGAAGGLVGPSSSSSTSVRGSAQAGVGALPPMAPISAVPVVVPDVAGISSAGLAAGAAAALGRRAAAKRSAPPGPPASPPVGGMGAGAMGARGGPMSRGGAGGRAGVRRVPTPVLEGAGGAGGPRRAGGALEDEDAQARRQAEKDAKRALLEEKRAERAARRARREAGDGEDRDEHAEPTTADEAGSERAEGAAAERPAAITVVHHAPGEEPEPPRR